ncbi:MULTISPECIES: hypothetical protein [unclassified Acidovorax]|nr:MULTISPECIES: hypothetical protein [unclassified Acidovorax]
MWSTPVCSRTLLAQGYPLQSPPPDATAAFFRSEASRMARLVKQAGLKLD